MLKLTPTPTRQLPTPALGRRLTGREPGRSVNRDSPEVLAVSHQWAKAGPAGCRGAAI